MKDNETDGTGGFAMIKEGGIHYKHVVIYFKSQTGHDIRFAVDIFAQPVQQTPPIVNPLPAFGSPSPTYGTAVQPAGWIYPSNTYQLQQSPYVFNRN